MKRALNYGDLGIYLNDLRNAHYHDPLIRAMLNAWSRFDRALPDFADTGISDEATEKLIKRFGEVVRNEYKPVTITSYSNKLREAVPRLREHYEATGSLTVAAPRPAPASEHSAGVPTYADMGEYFAAYRKDYPDEVNATRWLSTYNSVIARVPFAANEAIDPERTEAILDAFERVATSPAEARAAAKQVDEEDAERLLAMPILKNNTVKNYQFWFRHALRQYCEFFNLPPAEISNAERRERKAAEKRAQREAALAAEAERKAKAERKAASKPSPAVADVAPETAAPEEKLPKLVEEPATVAPEEHAGAVPQQETPQPLPEEVAEPEPVDEVGLPEYRFLLRPGVVVALALPEDLTRREADRLSQWIGSFVLDAGHETV